MNHRETITAKTLMALVALILASALGPTALAQSHTDTRRDEQALRELVRQENEGKQVIKYTDDSIFSSGAMPRPVIGVEARKKMGAELNAKRLNQTRKCEIVRLVVSESGDMAYEFSNFTMGFDTPERKHVSITGSFLRVWRKVNGEWMVEALSARPHEPTTTTAAN